MEEQHLKARALEDELSERLLHNANNALESYQMSMDPSAEHSDSDISSAPSTATSSDLIQPDLPETEKDQAIAQLQKHLNQWRESHAQLSSHFATLKKQCQEMHAQQQQQQQYFPSPNSPGSSPFRRAHSTGQEPAALEWESKATSPTVRPDASFRRTDSAHRNSAKEVLFGILGILVSDGMRYGSGYRYRLDYGEARIVDAWTPATDSGVVSGDVITAVNGFPVNNLNDLRLCLLFKPVELTIKRRTETLTLLVTPGQAGPEHQPGTHHFRAKPRLPSPAPSY